MVSPLTMPRSATTHMRAMPERCRSLEGLVRSLLDLLTAAAREIVSLDKQVGALAPEPRSPPNG
jgi:hypothetical protein